MSIITVLIVVTALELSAQTQGQVTTTCPPSKYGANCAVYCKEHDDATNGHYTCDSQGNKICRQGYKGPDTDCKNPNGTLCDRKPCQNGGACVNGTVYSYICVCTPLYTGNRCDVRLSTVAGQLLTTQRHRITTVQHVLPSGHPAANTRPSSATQPPQNSTASTDAISSDNPLVIGLSVGGGLLLLIALVIVIVFYKYGYSDKGKKAKIEPSEEDVD